MKYFLSIVIFMGAIFCAFAQNVSPEVKELKMLFDRYEQTLGYRILIHDKDIDKINPVTASDLGSDFLDRLVKNTPYTYFLVGNKYAVIYPSNLKEPYLEANRRKQDVGLEQRNFEVSGIIRDNEAKTVLGSALFSIPELELGILTDYQGKFSTAIPSGTYVAYFSAMGKATEQRIIRVYQPLALDITLFESISDLELVTVTDRAIDYNVKGTTLGVNRMPIEELKMLPPLLGEVDVVKGMLLLPGVTTVGEGASGFNVRGGGVDQNLILMDGAPIFNPSHMFGFFSIFNQDAVSEASIYKGDLPAKYGGRLSSVLDVKTKAGDSQNWTGTGGIGFLSSRLGFNGPISQRTQVMATGRYAYPNWIMHRIQNTKLKESSTYFYDGNLRLDHTIDETNQLSLSLYGSNDYFRFGRDTAYTWQSQAASLKWSSLWGEKLASDISLVYSSYQYSVLGEIEPLGFSLDSKISYISWHHELEWMGDMLKELQFGYQVNHYGMGMGTLRPENENSFVVPKQIPDDRGLELGVYAQMPWKLGEKLEGLAGFRYSGFLGLGNKDVYLYDATLPKSQDNIIDTLSYGAGEVYQQYFGFEPRLSLRYSLGDNTSIKASVNRSFQYLHLLSNNFASAPVDVWKLSDRYVRPQESWQYALGVYRNFDRDRIESSVEVYYKDFRSLVEYKDGASLILNPTLESDLVMGTGYAYGTEFLLKKKTGKINGWVSYTYSRTLRKVQGEFEQEIINQGRYFPANWDQPHDLSILLNYKPRKRISLSANFNYRTGRPITLPSSIYDIDGNIIVDYQERNQARIPDYHRLDLSLTFEGNQKKNSNYKSDITFSLYNVYARRNPFSWFFQPDFSGSVPRSYRLAVIGTVIPSVTYNFTFK